MTRFCIDMYEESHSSHIPKRAKCVLCRIELPPTVSTCQAHTSSTDDGCRREPSQASRCHRQGLTRVYASYFCHHPPHNPVYSSVLSSRKVLLDSRAGTSRGVWYKMTRPGMSSCQRRWYHRWRKAPPVLRSSCQRHFYTESAQGPIRMGHGSHIPRGRWTLTRDRCGTILSFGMSCKTGNPGS